MENLENLIESLPEFVSYIILGFVFLRIFRYVSTIKNSDEYEHVIWESILVGFALKSCFGLIPFSINPNTKEAYYGTLKYYEDYERHPQIVLQSYKYWEDYNDEPKLDCSNNPEYVVLLDTTQFSVITISYDSDSDKVKNKDENKPKTKFLKKKFNRRIKYGTPQNFV